jgi:hypothetical protein
MRESSKHMPLTDLYTASISVIRAPLMFVILVQRQDLGKLQVVDVVTASILASFSLSCCTDWYYMGQRSTSRIAKKNSPAKSCAYRQLDAKSFVTSCITAYALFSLWRLLILRVSRMVSGK